MNLNDLARRVTLKEGKKKSISIAQVKEVIRLTLIELANQDYEQTIKTLVRYQRNGKKRI